VRAAGFAGARVGAFAVAAAAWALFPDLAAVLG